MGNLIFWNYQELNKDLRDKSIEILEEKKQEIIKFFNSKGTFEKPIGNDYTQNPDKALPRQVHRALRSVRRARQPAHLYRALLRAQASASRRPKDRRRRRR